MSNWIKKEWKQQGSVKQSFLFSQLILCLTTCQLNGDVIERRAGSTARKWLTDVHLGSFGGGGDSFAGGVLCCYDNLSDLVSSVKRSFLVPQWFACHTRHIQTYWSCLFEKRSVLDKLLYGTYGTRMRSLRDHITANLCDGPSAARKVCVGVYEWFRLFHLQLNDRSFE